MKFWPRVKYSDLNLGLNTSFSAESQIQRLSKCHMWSTWKPSDPKQFQSSSRLQSEYTISLDTSLKQRQLTLSWESARCIYHAIQIKQKKLSSNSKFRCHARQVSSNCCLELHALRSETIRPIRATDSIAHLEVTSTLNRLYVGINRINKQLRMLINWPSCLAQPR